MSKSVNKSTIWMMKGLLVTCAAVCNRIYVCQNVLQESVTEMKGMDESDNIVLHH